LFAKSENVHADAVAGQFLARQLERLPIRGRHVDAGQTLLPKD
jgi:hypothetical protein